MRRTVLFWCSAAAVPPKKDDSKPSEKEQPKKSAKPKVESTPFSVFQFKSWQIQGLSAEDKAVLPPAILYHGKTIGSRPLIILDHSFRDAASCTPENLKKSASKYEGILSHLKWDHGSVYIPLVLPTDNEKHLLHYTGRQVSAVLDALDVNWTHVLGHSYGGLAAAWMMASHLYPHRVGSCLFMDTPLVTKEIVDNAASRAEIVGAEDDVNVPLEELDFAKSELLSSLEGPIPCPSPEDAEVYEKHLFDPKYIYEKEGLIRRDDRYLTVPKLRGIFHPMQFIVPSKEPLSDVDIHKEIFRLRRPAVIKEATGHKDLFSSNTSAEIADVIANWMNRFEPDVVLKRRYQQAAKEMSQLMGESQASGAGKDTPAAAAGSGDKKKKKEKKKK